MAKADPRKAELWRQHIESYKTSGLSRKAYCRKHRLNIHTLDYWSKRLRQPKVHSSKEDNGFIQIQVHDDLLSDSCIRLQIGQVTIEVADGFDPQHLKNILKVLGAAC